MRRGRPLVSAVPPPRAAISPDLARKEIKLPATALLSNDPQVAGQGEALKRLGFSIALDDLGTGYSCLSVLKRFALDRSKIARSFVSALVNHAAAAGRGDPAAPPRRGR